MLPILTEEATLLKAKAERFFHLDDDAIALWKEPIRVLLRAPLGGPTWETPHFQLPSSTHTPIRCPSTHNTGKL